MGAVSGNRIKFNKPKLKAIEKWINRGAFSKETYIYDADSHLVIRVRSGCSYIDYAFCM